MSNGYWKFVEAEELPDSLESILVADASTDSQELFREIKSSLARSVPIHGSVLDEINTRYRLYSNGECKTLDKAFKLGRPKNFNLSKFKKDSKLIEPVFCKIVELRNEDISLEKAFEQAGDLFSISASSARDYYYEIKRRYPEIFDIAPALDSYIKDCVAAHPQSHDKVPKSLLELINYVSNSLK